jgi:hypothetical protein
MADHFLSPTRGTFTRQNTSPGSGNHDQRIVRERVSEHRDRMDRAEPQRPSGAARMLVQVFDGGAMPNVSERVYFTHPVLVTGEEAEGGSGTLTADTTTTVPVIVLGHPPGVGDYLTAYLAGGRWVTEQLTGSMGSACYLATCGPCAIPKGDLTLNWSDTVAGNGATTLTYDGGGGWKSSCVNHNGGEKYSLSCSAGTILLVVTYYAAADCSGAATGSCSTVLSAPSLLVLSASTCSPFSLTYTTLSGPCTLLSGLGYTQFVITGPNYPDPPFGTCPVCFTVTGCTDRAHGAPIALAGATISLSGGASGTTGANGQVVIDVGSPGSQTVTTSFGGYVTDVRNISLACGQAVSISLSLCLPQTTLTATSALFGITWSLAWSASPLQWSGTSNYSFPGNATCAPATVPITLTVYCDSSSATGLSATLNWGIGGTFLACFVACPADGAGIPVSLTTSVAGTCTPVSYTAFFAATGNDCTSPGPPLNTPWGQLAGGASDTVTIT